MKVTIRSLMLLAVLVAILSLHWHRKAEKRRAEAVAAVQSLVDFESQLNRRASIWLRHSPVPWRSHEALLCKRKAAETRDQIQAICERWNLQEPAPSFWSPLELE